MFKHVIKEQLKVPAHTDYLADLREFVTRIGRKYGFSDRVINAFKLAIDEAGTNIMRHAYRETGGEGFITIRAIVKKNSLTICLIDQGKYFDPKHVKDPDLKRYVDIGKKGGLGIFIMRRLMDEIDYRKTEEGNELRLTKNRDTPTVTPKFSVPLPKAVKAVKTIPLTLKAKFWMRTSSVLLAITAAIYFYYFLDAERQETTRFFNAFIDGSNLVISSLQADTLIFLETSGLKASETIAALHGYDAVKNAIDEIVIVDALGIVLGHTNHAGNYLKKFDLPQNRQEVRPDLSIVSYTLPLTDANGEMASKEVYDRIVVMSNGELHIRTSTETLRERIAAQRWTYARTAGVMLVLICVGSFLLIYILMNPFRKLADWVRSAGHGDIGDEMDIDASTEIGEIAQAFSEITNKFRESQKNLAEQERLQKEMQVAQEIQQTLLPAEFPDLEGYEIASYYEAAREVGGDYYDFVEVDKDTLGIVVADVSGKGVPGSLVMTMIRTALRTEARGLKDAAEVLSRVNDFVIGDMKKGMFVTVFYVIIDSKRRRLNYASAGHNPMILYRASTKRTYYLNPRGFPIGIQLHEKDLFKKSIESDTIQLAEDDILLIYTDGITEAMNSKRELFGEERLLKTFREFGQLRVNPFVEKIKEEIASFTEGMPQSDDITLVAIREKTSPEKEELRRAKEAHHKIMAGLSIREACESVGITTYAYYNKYKKEFEEKGIENYEIDVDASVEAKHIAIEDKVKIYDIIKNHPEYGAKRISEELNIEKYGFTVISESKIYDELVRSRLNTRQLREGFVARGGRSRRPMKQPGTPLLTLDGKVILDRNRLPEPARKEPEAKPEVWRRPMTREKPPSRPETSEPPIEISPRPLPAPATTEPAMAFARSNLDLESRQRKDMAKVEIDVHTLQTPLEELLDKKRSRDDTPRPFADRFAPPTPSDPVGRHDKSEIASPEESSQRNLDVPDLHVNLDTGRVSSDHASTPASRSFSDNFDNKTSAGELGVSFEDLFAGGSILDEVRSSSEVMPADSAAAPPPEETGLALPEATRSAPEEDSDAAFFAVEDVLRQEFDNNYSTVVTSEAADEENAEALAPVSIAASPLQKTASEEGRKSPGEEMDLPYVDVQEILEQSFAGESSLVIEEHAGAVNLNAKAALSGANLQPALRATPAPAISRHGAGQGNGTQGSGPEIGAPGKPPAEVPLPKSIRHKPDGPLSRPGDSSRGGAAGATKSPGSHTASEIASAAPATGPSDRNKDDRNGLAPGSRREDERERLLIAGLRHYKNQRFKEAIAEFEKAIRIYPDFKEAYSILGNAYFRNRMYDNAAAAYTRVKEMDPKDTTAYENMGVIYANRGEYVEAMKEWQRVLEIDPNRDDIRKKIERASRMVTKKAAV